MDRGIEEWIGCMGMWMNEWVFGFWMGILRERERNRQREREREKE